MAMTENNKNRLGAYAFLYVGGEYLDASYEDMKKRGLIALDTKYKARYNAHPKEARRLEKLYREEKRKVMGQLERLKKLLDEILTHFDKSDHHFQNLVEELYETFDKQTENYGGK